MRNIFSFFIVGLLFFPAGILATQEPGMADPIVASINLIRPSGGPGIITKNELDEKFTAYNSVRSNAGAQPLPATAENKRQILDLLIADMLVRQAVDRDQITYTENELARAIQSQKANLERQVGRTFSNAEFQQYVTQRFKISWEQFREQIGNEIKQRSLLQKHKQSVLAAAQTPPSSGEINNFFRSNRSRFSNPEYVRFNQIFIKTIDMGSSDREAALNRCREALRLIQNGSQFSDIAVQYSEDERSKYRGGDAGFLPINDNAAISLLGQEFVDSVFQLSIGQVSEIITSKVGFHIAQVTEKQDARLLELGDKIAPSQEVTVREYIARLLIQQKQNEVFKRALNELIAELKNQAEISVFEENLA